MNQESVGELLAVLTASGRWGESLSGNGPTKRISLHPSDVAAALAQVKPDVVADLLLVMYCHHHIGDIGPRMVPILRQDRRLAFTDSFDDARLVTLIFLALADLAAPVVCVSCQGRGLVRQQDICGTCGGTGTLPKQRASVLAATFGVAKSTWSEHWAWRYQIVFQILNQHLADGLFQLKRALGY